MFWAIPITVPRSYSQLCLCESLLVVPGDPVVPGSEPWGPKCKALWVSRLSSPALNFVLLVERDLAKILTFLKSPYQLFCFLWSSSHRFKFMTPSISIFTSLIERRRVGSHLAVLRVYSWLCSGVTPGGVLGNISAAGI